MIASDLDRLRAKDPATWEKIAHGMQTKPRGQYLTYDRDGRMTAHQITDAYIPFSELPQDAACAFLQAVLQDACQKRGWDWQVQIWNRTPVFWIAYVVGNGQEQKAESDNSPTEALLAAYLETIGDE